MGVREQGQQQVWAREGRERRRAGLSRWSLGYAQCVTFSVSLVLSLPVILRVVVDEEVTAVWVDADFPVAGEWAQTALVGNGNLREVRRGRRRGGCRGGAACVAGDQAAAKFFGYPLKGSLVAVHEEGACSVGATHTA